METTNLISTPDITGNIGTCTSNGITYVSGRDGIFTETLTTTVTNSCTGEVKSYEHWGFTNFASGIVAFFIISLIFVSTVIFITKVMKDEIDFIK